MSTLTERLQILIDADAKGAVREMEKFGASTEAATGKAKSKIDGLAGGLTKFGVASIGVGAVAAVGIKKVIQAYDEAEIQQKKLTNSIQNSKSAFASNGQALRDQAQALQHVTAADGDLIVGAQSVLVQMGLTEKQTKSLTPLVVDLSRKMGIDLNSAAKLVGKSIDGSGGALQKLLGPMDKSAYAADHFGTTFDKLKTTVGGFAQVEGKTASGQMEILKNNLHDLEESAGKGAVSALSDLTGAIGHLGSVAGASQQHTAELVGKFGTFAAGGAVVIGAVSLIGGQFLKLYQGIQKLGPALQTAKAELQGFGVAGSASLAVVAAGLYEIDKNAQSDAFKRNFGNIDTTKPRAAIDALKGSVKDLNGTGLLATNSWSEKFRDSAIDVSNGGGVIMSTLVHTKEGVQGLDKVIGEINTHMKGLSSTDKIAFLTQLQTDADAAGIHIQGLSQYIDTQKNKLKEHGGAAKQAAEGITVVGDESKSTTDKVKGLNDALRAQVDPLFAVQDAANKVHEAQVNLLTVQKESGKNSPEYAAALRDQATAGLDLDGAMRTVNATLADNPAAAKQSIDALSKLKDQGVITSDQFNTLAGGILNTVKLAQSNPAFDIDTSTAWSKLTALQQQMATLGVQSAVSRGQSSVHANNAGSGFGPGHAAGGPVKAGVTYPVGELGPELFTPRTDGYIIPNRKIRGGDGASITQNIHYEVTVASPHEPRKWIDESLWRFASVGTG